MWLDYCGLRVQELDRAVRFYTEAAGLRELRRGTMDHGGVWVLLEDNLSHQRLELNWYPVGSAYATAWKAGEELDHLGFRSTDAEGMAKRLIAAGAREVDRIREGEDAALIYLRDPEGITIEIIPSEVDG